MENTEKISWKETYLLNKRTILLLCKESPLLFTSTGIYSAVNALIPYLTLYFSAQILNELAGARRIEILHRQIIILLAAQTVTIAVKAITFRWKNTLSSDLFNYINQILAKKLLHLDFCAADDIRTYELLDNIKQTERWYGWGIHRLYYHFQDFLEALFKIIGAIALSVSLFTLQVSEDAGCLALLNNPVFIFLLLLIMAAATFLSPYLELLGAFL